MKKFFVLCSMFYVLCSAVYGLWTMDCHADTVYFNNGTNQKGLVVEEFYDRFVFNTEDGEKEILKSRIDEIFFDEPYQNNLYMGARFENNGDFESALKFYRFALQDYPDYKPAQDALKGLEDAKWRFGKTWKYAESKTILKAQLGLELKKVKEKIVVKKAVYKDSDILAGDTLISCWAHPLTYAGLKNASRLLIGLSNTLLNIVIERDMRLGDLSALELFPILTVNMSEEGPFVDFVKEGRHPYKKGLREGDIIVRIDGESTRYMKLNDVKKRIFSRKDKIVTIRRRLTVMRKRAENPPIKNAMWVWHSKEILLSEKNKKEFLDFCKEKNIGTLFFQLQYQFLPVEGRPACEILHQNRLKAFISEAHSRDIKVHALDGASTFCLHAQHPLVIAQIKAILAYNSSVSDKERFDGVHYDNEPYLLAGYHSGMKDDILKQYLSLNKKCREFITSGGTKLEFGVDIPFWFNQLDNLDRKLIDICDNVGIMDYRNFAAGSDGIINHALEKLKYAVSVDKKVFVGIETSEYPRQEIYFASCPSEENFNKIMGEKGAGSLAGQNKFEGFDARVYPYENRVYIGLVKLTASAPQEPDGAFTRALLKLGGEFGRLPRPRDAKEYEELVFSSQHDLLSNPEFRDIQMEDYNDENGNAYLSFKVKEVMLDKLTFAGLTEKDLNAVLAEAGQEFKKYPSFAGFAIHYYRSYKALCEKK